LDNVKNNKLSTKPTQLTRFSVTLSHIEDMVKSYGNLRRFCRFCR